MSKSKQQNLQIQIEDLVESQGGIKNMDLKNLANLTKNIYQALLNAELKEHLGYEKNSKSVDGNHRNGHGKKTIKGDFGETEIEVPRDRKGSFELKIIEKHSRTAAFFTDQIISLYARGMTIREI